MQNTVNPRLVIENVLKQSGVVWNRVNTRYSNTEYDRPKASNTEYNKVMGSEGKGGVKW